ncbi:site-specific integrase [Streptomyces sp. NPDC101234]|uniref:site-specific integrase n=1 Tax=Streptomyces sp. NPDC101234 TaxID=3366138 RepID=UPI0038156003
MSKLAYISGVRAAELCPVQLGEVHWENGQWGRFLVHGKGAGGSGPRDREAFLFQEGRELLWWYVEEVRGEFPDDPSDPRAPLFPSERLAKSLAGMDGLLAPPVVPDTFRRALKMASREHLRGPVSELFPHLLRHVVSAWFPCGDWLQRGWWLEEVLCAQTCSASIGSDHDSERRLRQSWLREVVVSRQVADVDTRQPVGQATLSSVPASSALRCVRRHGTISFVNEQRR